MSHTVFALTSKGRSARSGAGGALPLDMVRLLGQVDGRRTRAELLASLGRSATAAGGLRWLTHAGLIAPLGQEPDEAATTSAPAVETETPKPAKAPAVSAEQSAQYLLLFSFMTEAVREHLGMRGFRLQLQIERASGTAELIELLPRLVESIHQTVGEAAALEFKATARALMLQG